MRHSHDVGAVLAAAALSLGLATNCLAEAPTKSAEKIRRLQRALDKQAGRLAADERLLAEQARLLEDQRSALARQQEAVQRLLTEDDAREARAKSVAPAGATTLAAAAPASEPTPLAQSQTPGAPSVQPVGPAGPVGQAPAPEPLRQVALPEGVNVLTPKGHFVADEAITYEQDSSNRLVFRGVEIVPGIQLGLIEANTASRNSAIATETFRYGLFKRFEIEALVPYVYRSDRVQTVSQRDQTITQGQTLHGSGIGDVEVTGRYQLTGGTNGWPILVGNLRVKTDTGRGPFDVRYDDQGVAQTLAVGSGFWGVEPSLSAIYTSDPVVIFGNLSYLRNFERNINKQVGGALVGDVKPGDSVGASVGFAFSVNPQFSFTLGYRHNYIFPTSTELAGVRQRSTDLQIGSLLFGWSYRFSNRLNIVSNVEAGVTSDAPNVVINFRVPFVF